MICVLAETGDDDALWLTAALRHRGEAVELVLPEELLVGARLTCRVETAGQRAQLTLLDGRRLDDGDVSLVVNRLGELPAVTATAGAADAAYLREEWRAALAAWLRSLRCPVVNPPRAAWLSGPVLSPAAWRAAAAAHGFDCAPWRSDDDPELHRGAVDVLFLAGHSFGGDSATRRTLAEPMAGLSAHVGAPLLGISFAVEGDRWRFLQATARPRLRPTGSPLVEALARCAHDGVG